VSALTAATAVTSTVVGKQMETTLCDPPKAKFGNASVSIGVAVQVASSSYVPVKSAQSQRGQYKTQVTPPPVPPRSALRLSVNAGADHYAAPTSPYHLRSVSMPCDPQSTHFALPNRNTMQSHVTRTYRQPPLLEESDLMEKSSDSQQQQRQDLSPEACGRHLAAGSLNLATSSNESLAFVEETVRLLPTATCPENDEDTLI